MRRIPFTLRRHLWVEVAEREMAKSSMAEAFDYPRERFEHGKKYDLIAALHISMTEPQKV